MAESLKEIYNQNYIELLANNLLSVNKHFPKKAFINSVFDKKWAKKSLKTRMRHISTTLGNYLPKEYEKAIDILKEVFAKMSSDYNLENMIFQDFVEVYGLEYFDKSMEALEYFTVESSSEFAIRAFILNYPEKTMEQMKVWAKSPNLDVRRLASEGCRPRLPWSYDIPYFKRNPKKVLEILDLLKDDKSSYVRVSVANNLNDISKDNPLIFKKTVKQWLGVNPKRDMMLKKACNTLLKQGDKKVLEMFGLGTIDVKIEEFQIDKDVFMGEDLHFSFTLVSEKTLGKIRVEYALTFVRQSAKEYRKVFKVYEGTCKQKRKELRKKFSFKPIAIRKYYEGKHDLEIIVNGKTTYKTVFTLHQSYP